MNTDDTTTAGLEQEVDRSDEDRRAYLQGALALQKGDLLGAQSSFRRATRQCSEPYAALARVALGECLRVDGKEGAALRAWTTVADNEHAPIEARRLALVSLQVAYERRDDVRRAAQTAQALSEIEASTRG